MFLKINYKLVGLKNLMFKPTLFILLVITFFLS